MKLILKTGLLAAMMFALVGSTAAQAAIYGGPLPASPCAAGKSKCVIKGKACLLGCYNKIIAKGGSLDSACVAKCTTGVEACAQKLDDKGGCIAATVGDGPVLRSKIEAHVQEMVAALASPSIQPAGNKCTAGKVKCLIKYNGCVLGLAGKALKPGGAIADLTKCNALLVDGAKPSCFKKLEDKLGVLCQTNGDAGAIKAADDAFINDVIFDLVSGQDMDTRRCDNDTSVHCTTNAQCGAGTCQFWFGAPLPLAAGGIASCVTNQWNGGITGTFEQETGKSGGTAKVLSRVYTGGNSINNPCPVCNGNDIPNDGALNGTCSAGARAGLSCDRNGESPTPSFGFTSLDCPPSGGTLVGTLPVDLTNTNTGAVTKTVGATSPNCNGLPGFKCMCSSCSGNSSVPCFTDTDCSAVGAGTCTNNAGEPRRPNACLDDTSNAAPPHCSATAVAGEGACEIGPVDQHCAAERFRSCTLDTDCLAGDKCVTENRACFPNYDGNVGDSITAVGSFGAPSNHTGTSTFASIFCVAPTTAGAVNAAGGLPGPGRLKLSGVASEDGTAGACPTVATFLPTAKGGVLDTGWTGLAHNASVVGQGKVTVGVTGCTGSPGSCHCTYSGPVAN